MLDVVVQNMGKRLAGSACSITASGMVMLLR
jgi:hypothetical protein